MDQASLGYKPSIPLSHLKGNKLRPTIEIDKLPPTREQQGWWVSTDDHYSGSMFYPFDGAIGGTCLQTKEEAWSECLALASRPQPAMGLLSPFQLK